MAIDVTIRQPFLGRKTMPLDVILGSEMQYGRLESNHLITGEAGESDIIVFHPDFIGRGFSVTWTPGETKELNLRLPIPSTDHEIRHFYAAVSRMASFWKAKPDVDGAAMSVNDFMKGLDNMIAFNERVIRHMVEEVLNGKHKRLEIHSAMWPLAMGVEEAQRFADNPALFGEWLHEKQSADVYHAPVNFYDTDEGVCGVFVCVDECTSVYPRKPAVPLFLTDPNTGKPLECSKWVVVLVPQSEKEQIGEIDFELFVERLGQERITRYDEGHFLMQPLSEQELRNLLTQTL